MPNLEMMVQQMEQWCNDDSHGYSQYRRYGPDYDCSSAVIEALKRAGWNMGGALTTDHIRAPLVQQGWAWLPPYVEKKRGDILLSEEYHVAVYVGNGMLAEFAIDEEGGIAGNQPGDQTGTEAYIHAYYDYPWDGVLRYTGQSEEESEDDMRFICRPNGENFMVYYDGVYSHPLAHPDEVTSIQMAAKAATGKELKCFDFGTKMAPWFTRFRQATERKF